MISRINIHKIINKYFTTLLALTLNALIRIKNNIVLNNNITHENSLTYIYCSSVIIPIISVGINNIKWINVNLYLSFISFSLQLSIILHQLFNFILTLFTNLFQQTLYIFKIHIKSRKHFPSKIYDKIIIY